jgi:SAM-dependent methyltransferase
MTRALHTELDVRSSEQLVRLYDSEIAPLWCERFRSLLLRGLSIPECSQVLEVGCATGRSTADLMRLIPSTSRLIAIDPSRAMLDLARRRVHAAQPHRQSDVFFRTESWFGGLWFADQVYDVVVSNLGLSEVADPGNILRDFARVTVLGGEVRCSLPLAETFREFHDLLGEILLRHDDHAALDRLHDYLSHCPTVTEVEGWMSGAGLRGQVLVEEFELSFRSGREFLSAPVIEFGPLRDWKAIVEAGANPHDTFRYVEHAIDEYCRDRAFSLTVRGACLIGIRQEICDSISNSISDSISNSMLVRRQAQPLPLAMGSVIACSDGPRNSVWPVEFNHDHHDHHDDDEDGDDEDDVEGPTSEDISTSEAHTAHGSPRARRRV